MTRSKAGNARPLQVWFAAKVCAPRRALWDAGIERGMQEMAKEANAGEQVSRKDIEAIMAANARHDRERLDAEADRMLVRTGIIISAATLLFAVFAIKSGSILGWPILLTAMSFAAAVWPLRPPFWRAWMKRFNKRDEWTLLAVTDFQKWAMECEYGDRLTPVITIYKRWHAVAVPLLVVATIMTAYGLR